MAARSRHQPVFIPLCGLRKAMVIPGMGDFYITVIPAEAGIQRGADVASTALSQITLIVLPGNLQKRSHHHGRRDSAATCDVSSVLALSLR